MRAYAIGDIHGQLAKLETAHALIAADRERTGDERAPVVHLGDLVDRGPDSCGVIDYLIDGISAGAPWQVLKGNHDRMFLKFVREAQEDPRLFTGLSYLHPRIGGIHTLLSYGIARGVLSRDRDLARKAADVVPEEHLGFIEAMPLYQRMGNYLFVHAGISPGVPLDEQVEEDLIWIRAPFLESTRDHGFIVVHGHTPVDTPEHLGNRIALDTGAGFGGPVTAAVFEDSTVSVLTAEGRMELRPPPT